MFIILFLHLLVGQQQQQQQKKQSEEPPSPWCVKFGLHLSYHVPVPTSRMVLDFEGFSTRARSNRTHSAARNNNMTL